MPHKQIAILYHGGCPDGIGGAYAAWKKFSDEADYIPVKYGKPIPEHLSGMDLFLIDFCYPRPSMDELVKVAKSVTVLDHHEGIREVASSFPGVFDASRSGATIAWSYFHPDTPIPKLLSYIEDGDLYKFTVPNSRDILAYVYSSNFQEHEHLDTLVRELEDEEEMKRIVHIGAFFSQYHQHIIDGLVRHAELVQFEGYECYLTSSTGAFTSDTGNTLVRQKAPIAIIISADATGIRVSLRSDETVDVSALAQKYGGNGHPRAAGFRLNYGSAVPWTPIVKNEDTGH